MEEKEFGERPLWCRSLYCSYIQQEVQEHLLWHNTAMNSLTWLERSPRAWGSWVGQTGLPFCQMHALKALPRHQCARHVPLRVLIWGTASFQSYRPLRTAALHDATSSHFLLIKHACLFPLGQMLVSIAAVLMYTEKFGFLTNHYCLSLTSSIPTIPGKFRINT